MPKEQDTVAYRKFVSSVKRMRMKGKENSYIPEAEAESEQSIRSGESHCVELQALDLVSCVEFVCVEFVFVDHHLSWLIVHTLIIVGGR